MTALFDGPPQEPYPQRRKSERRRRTELAVARMYPDELAALKKAAALRGVSVGELIRAALRHELEART